MKKTLFLSLSLLLTTAQLFAQLKISPNGKSILGNQPPGGWDMANRLSAHIWGQFPGGTGGRVAFGDYGDGNTWTMNVYMGELGDGDSDILELGGSMGFRFSTIGAGTYEAARLDHVGNFHVRGTIYGNSSIYSDSRLKRNILGLSSSTSLQNILKMRGVQFDWKTDAEDETLEKLNLAKVTTAKEKARIEDYKRGLQKKKTEAVNQIGFIAQEVQLIYPQLVKTDENGTLSVNYVGLVPVLVEALKEQQAQIADLKARIEKLEKK